jgi:hypothetical protein
MQRPKPPVSVLYQGGLLMRYLRARLRYPAFGTDRRDRTRHLSLRRRSGMSPGRPPTGQQTDFG